MTFTLAIIAGCLFIFSSLLIYKNIQENHRYNAENELQIINQLQLRSLRNWRESRFAEAKSLTEDQIFGRILTEWINNNQRFSQTALHSYIKNRLDVLTELFDYDSVYILDTNGEFLVSSGDNSPKYLPELEKEALKQSSGESKAQLLKYLPIENRETPVGLAMHGSRGIFYGPDYDGQNVIVYSSSLANTPWMLITKINEAVALDKSQRELFSITLPIIIGLIFIWLTIAYKQHLSFKRQRNLNLSLELEAAVDPLTGLANRRTLDKNLEIYWQQSLKTGKEIALIMFDVDYFKKYNDHYGHLKGDQCLIQIANIAKQIATRSTDTVARYGGEEFMILLPGTSPNNALRLANQLRQDVYDTKIEHIGSTYKQRLTVSVGVACINGADNKNMDWKFARRILISQADRALYEAKADGRNTVRI